MTDGAPARGGRRAGRACAGFAKRSTGARADCGRDPASVRLIAVSKTFSADEVWPTIARGGQRRVRREPRAGGASQMARSARRAAAIGKTIELHLIGPLQSNKAREAVETFDVIQTVDREKIAAALAERDGEDRQDAAPVRRGQHRRRAAEGGRGPAGRRRLHRALPREIPAGDRRADVHPAARRTGLAAFRAARRDRATQRRRRAVDGHERRLAARGASSARPMCASAARSSARAADPRLSRSSSPRLWRAAAPAGACRRRGSPRSPRSGSGRDARYGRRSRYPRRCAAA